ALIILSLGARYPRKTTIVAALLFTLVGGSVRPGLRWVSRRRRNRRAARDQRFSHGWARDLPGEKHLGFLEPSARADVAKRPPAVCWPTSTATPAMNRRR